MKTIYVGLTGLSRAGKTVFLTSAIHDFIECTGRDLPEFKFGGWRYVGNPEQVPDGIDPFRYKDHVKAFRQDPPNWPEPTRDITEYRLRLQLVHDDNRRRQGTIVFVDYPGERLLDVALLDTSYEDWSDKVSALLQEPFEDVRDAAHEFLACVETMQPDKKGTLPDHKWQMAQRTFGEFCLEKRKVRQPIAPVLPVLLAEKASPGISAPFFPLNLETRKRLPLLHQRLKKEYASYLKTAVSPFLRSIAACSHQIVLVDVLDVLRSGVEKHDEVREQMQRVLSCYRKINSGWFNHLWSLLPLVGRPLIHKVTFCATKADQATKDHRENLVSLLRELFVRAEQALQFNRHTVKKIEFLAIAAHRCTDDIDTDHEGKPVVALQGRLIDHPTKEEGLYYPGRVPQQWPESKEDWLSFRFPNFRPRRLPDITIGKPLPHIKMDQVLFSIVEDIVP